MHTIQLAAAVTGIPSDILHAIVIGMAAGGLLFFGVILPPRVGLGSIRATRPDRDRDFEEDD